MNSNLACASLARQIMAWVLVTASADHLVSNCQKEIRKSFRQCRAIIALTTVLESCWRVRDKWKYFMPPSEQLDIVLMAIRVLKHILYVYGCRGSETERPLQASSIRRSNKALLVPASWPCFLPPSTSIACHCTVSKSS